MAVSTPLVSVSMLAYNAENFIAASIEGVLAQQVDFPIELVLGDDCSKDRTRQICESYAARFPQLIRVLPPEPNMGIAANTLRTMSNCRGKYIAVCDGDDIWTDPLKLRKQVDFLENHPRYGIVYTDVETIGVSGKVIDDPEQRDIRSMYASGYVFFKLLQANFINNSTAVFRREWLEGHLVYPDRTYQIPDHIRWLYLSVRGQVHFMNYPSTQYRKHDEGLSVAVPRSKIIGNRRMLRKSLYHIIPAFHRHSDRPLNRDEKMLVFRRILSLVLRPPGSAGQRLRILRLAPAYFPGIRGLSALGFAKLRCLFGFATKKIVLLSHFKDSLFNACSPTLTSIHPELQCELMLLHC